MWGTKRKPCLAHKQDFTLLKKIPYTGDNRDLTEEKADLPF